MKNDLEIMEQVRSAINECTRGIDNAPSLRYRILKQAKGEPPVKKKFSVALALAMVMMLLVSGAFAATLLNSDILNWLFRGGENEAPQEIVDLVDQTNQIQQTDQLALTLNETLFDGNKLSVSLTLHNPTDELLIYTIDQAKLNGKPLAAETALLPYGYGYGQALGGEVEGQALSGETQVFATFTGVYEPSADLAEEPEQGESNLISSAPLQSPLQAMEKAEFSIRVDVYRSQAPLAFLAPGEYLAGSAFLSEGVLAIQRENNLLLAELGQAYLEKVDSQEFTFPIRMNNAPITTVSAVPGVYENDLFSLEMEHFSLSAASGQLIAHITIPSPSEVKAALPEDLSFFYVFPEEVYEQARENNDASLALRIHTQSGAGSIDPESDLPAYYDVDASFGSTSGALPSGVYLVWMTDNNGILDWDTSLYVPLK